MMTSKGKVAKTSLYSAVDLLYSEAGISADCDFSRGNREASRSKRKFPTEPGNKSSEE